MEPTNSVLHDTDDIHPSSQWPGQPPSSHNVGIKLGDQDISTEFTIVTVPSCEQHFFPNQLLPRNNGSLLFVRLEKPQIFSSMNPSLRSWVGPSQISSIRHLLVSLDISRRSRLRGLFGVVAISTLWLQARPGLFSTKALWLGSLPFLSEFFNCSFKIT